MSIYTEDWTDVTDIYLSMFCSVRHRNSIIMMEENDDVENVSY